MCPLEFPTSLVIRNRAQRHDFLFRPRQRVMVLRKLSVHKDSESETPQGGLTTARSLKNILALLGRAKVSLEASGLLGS